MKSTDLMASMSESDYMDMIIDRARARGWRVHHCRPARSSTGWSTPIQGHPGFVDLVLAKSGRVLFIEVKSERGRVSPDQAAWLDHLDGLVVRPSDWSWLQKIIDGEQLLPRTDVRIREGGDASQFEGRTS